MATPSQLTQKHQRQATMVANAAVDEVMKLVRQADPSDIDGWFWSHESQIMRIVESAWNANRDLAAIYLRDHAVANDSFTAVYRALFSSARVNGTIQSTGPAAFKRVIANGGTPEGARRAMERGLRGSLFRQVYSGSRDTILQTVSSSSTIRGYRRISGGVPCSFCAMLIARGAVYSKSSANFQAHDHDRCLPEPMYRREKPTKQEQQLKDLWDESTEGLSGKDAINAFRRAYQNPS